MTATRVSNEPKAAVTEVSAKTRGGSFADAVTSATSAEERAGGTAADSARPVGVRT